MDPIGGLDDLRKGWDEAVIRLSELSTIGVAELHRSGQAIGRGCVLDRDRSKAWLWRKDHCAGVLWIERDALHTGSSAQ